MGLIADTFRPLFSLLARQGVSGPVSPPGAGFVLPSSLGGGSANYTALARSAYGGNEAVYSAIELRATSAAEPRIVGYRQLNEKTRQRLYASLMQAGASNLQAGYQVRNLHETVTDHPAVRLLNNPNPYMTRFQFWSTVIMHRDIAGNAYAWKGRSRGPGTEPDSLWLLRPDRVRVLPDSVHTIRAYRYSVGSAFIEYPAEDVIHFKTRHPYDDHYGLPPLMPLLGRLDLDNYMREFPAAFFRHGGNPGAVLSVKQKLSQENKDEIRNRFQGQYGGPAGWFALMVLDQAEASFSPMTMNLGQRGLVLPELSAITEARIAMTFGIPASILGLFVGMESSSYANKRQDWQVFWDITLAPLYSDLDDTLNLYLLPDFTGLEDLAFDLSQIKALQEDVDKMHDRLRKDLMAGAISIEEFRSATGRDPSFMDGTFLASLMGIQDRQIIEKVESLGILIRAGFDPVGSLHALDLPDIRHTGKLPVTIQASAGALRSIIDNGAQIEAPKAKVVEARCPSCGKLCARDISEGESVYCRRCKQTFPAGIIEPSVTARTVRRRIVRDAEGRISEIIEDEVDAAGD